MKNKRGEVDWLRLLGDNCWQWDSAESHGEDYSHYKATILGFEYDVGCIAMVSDSDSGYHASGDYGVAWIECDISTFTSADYLTTRDADEIIWATRNAEANLIKCGVPFIRGYKFKGKNAANMARRNAAIRKKLGLDKEE